MISTGTTHGSMVLTTAGIRLGGIAAGDGTILGTTDILDGMDGTTGMIPSITAIMDGATIPIVGVGIHPL